VVFVLIRQKQNAGICLRFVWNGAPRKCRQTYPLNLAVQFGRVPVTSGTSGNGMRTTVAQWSAAIGEIGSRRCWP